MTTALYRRYRPDTFADVIGQEHVTEPLMTALRKNRVNHAYLFSGPRGCGKTTSARILARCLNCAQSPTDTPCGSCDSCVELATGGPGSLDVIEIDAASHGGVDDARDLRERATFAPVRDRYKIFIIDEAHMVTSAGFNALLKIVEEPPEHIKFIFATTEPEKVIGTIRSRTHHYPFRLVPPEPLMAYLQLLCDQEKVPVAPGVLSLVVRAGGGSVRDSLSVLDQLMAGAGAQGLDYELAVSLLGYTHASLLDDVVDALAASDAATVFRAVDRIIQTGLDPRRFVEDLLERFRDLIIVQAMPESAQAILRGMPEDQIARMQTQSTQLGRAELSRAADVSNTALTEMTGATSPRLHLELLCARLLLPGAEQTERGMAARLDRVERRLSYAGSATAEQGAPERPAPVVPVSTPEPAPAAPPAVEPRESAASAETADMPENLQKSAPASASPELDYWGIPVQSPPARTQAPAPQTPAQQAPEHQPAAPEPQTLAAQSPAQRAVPPTSSAPANSADGIDMLRRAWPDVLEQLTKVKRSSWALIAPNATPQSFDGKALVLGFGTEGLASAFSRGEHAENLRAAIKATLGLDCQVTATASGAPPANYNSGSSEPNPKGPAQAVDWAGPAEQSTPAEPDWAIEDPRPSEEQPVEQHPIEQYPAEKVRPSTEPDPREKIWQRPVSAQPAAVVEPGWGSISAAPDWISGASDDSQTSAARAPASSEPVAKQPVSAVPVATAAVREKASAVDEPVVAKTSLFQRLSEQAKQSAPPPVATPETYVEDIPSADDETIEESGLVGRAAVERILGGRMIEERPLNRS